MMCLARFWKSRFGAACLAASLFVLYGGAARSADDREASKSAEQPKDSVSETDVQTIFGGRVVDEQGRGVADVSVIGLRSMTMDMATTSTSDGNFRLKAPPEFASLMATLRMVPWQIMAKHPDGRRGIAAWNANPMEIVLKPPRTLTVEATDGAGKPLAGATTIVQIGQSLVGGIPVYPLATGETDATGQWQVMLPIDAVIEQVVALKRGAGFDHFSSLTKPRGFDRRPLPDKVSLKLDGARTVRFRAINSEGQPLAGVAFYPWWIRTHEDADPVTLAWPGAQVFTDVTGVAAFDWLPKSAASGIQFGCASNLYHMQSHFITVGRAGDVNLNVPVFRSSRILGRATFADGTPAANLRIRANGLGEAGSDGGQARTTQDGSFEIIAQSGKAYVVFVEDARWAAPTHVGVQVKEGEDSVSVDFTVVEGTILRGTLTAGKARQPVVNSSMFVLRDFGKVPFPPRAGWGSAPNLVEGRTAATSRDGHFQFCLPPGRYELNGNLGTLKPIPVEITEQGEIVRDVHVPRAASTAGRDRLQAKVIDSDGSPAGVSISGTPRSPVLKYAGQTATRPSDGIFQFSAACVPLVLHAKTPDGLLAGVLRLENDTQDRTIRLGKTATAKGRLLVEPETSLADVRLRYGIPVYEDESANDSASQTSFGDLVSISPEGKFELKTLIPGEEYVLEYETPPESNHWARLKAFEVPDLAPVDLGNIRLPAPAN